MRLFSSKISSIYKLIKEALNGTEGYDYTRGPIQKAVILLAIPMVLEMAMESVFALVDLYFVGHLENSSFAVQTVGLTESVLTIIYSLAIGISMAATAVVARRIGEKKPEQASKAGVQAILIAMVINTVLSVFGIVYATQILIWMGASNEAAVYGTNFVRIMMGGVFQLCSYF